MLGKSFPCLVNGAHVYAQPFPAQTQIKEGSVGHPIVHPDYVDIDTHVAS